MLNNESISVVQNILLPIMCSILFTGRRHWAMNATLIGAFWLTARKVSLRNGIVCAFSPEDSSEVSRDKNAAMETHAVDTCHPARCVSPLCYPGGRQSCQCGTSRECRPLWRCQQPDRWRPPHSLPCRPPQS